MKLAIIGSSPQALETAVRFHLHGAALTWFNAEEYEYEKDFPFQVSDYVTEQGLSLLNQKYQASDWQSWKEQYYKPLTVLLAQEQKVRPHTPISISKRYLAPTEQLKDKSRFYDLFRIIFQVNPQEFIREQAEQNPETFQRLTEELKSSLQSNLEMYEDFDVVIDLRRSTEAGSLAFSGRALGEGRVSKDQLLYGYEALRVARALNQDAGDVRELALVGSTPLAEEMIMALESWLKDQRSRLFVVSSEAWPFEKATGKLAEIFQHLDQEFEQDVNTFHQQLREWQALDDFIQAKKPKPVEPIPRLVFFSGHNATAVDQLIDKRRLFLTLEKPDFREGHRHPDNNALELKTIGADRILVATALKKPLIETHLAADEAGYFNREIGNWKNDLELIKGIENEIFKLFSPAGAH